MTQLCPFPTTLGISTGMEFSLANTSPESLPLEPPPPTNPPDINLAQPPDNPETPTLADQQNHFLKLPNPKPTEGLNQEDRESRQNGNYAEQPNLNSYKKKLLNESRHVYFPTWFEDLEEKQNTEESNQESKNELNVPEISFNEQELHKFREPWRTSLIIQTVNYRKAINPRRWSKIIENMENQEESGSHKNRARILCR